MVNGTYKRKISKGRFLLALFLTSLVFLLGLLVGHTLTLDRTDYLEKVAYKQKLDYESLQLQSLYLDLSTKGNESNIASCSIFNSILESSLTDVADAQAKVDFYILEGNEKSYTELKRDYALAQIRYWLLNERIKEDCKSKHVSLLYFYSNEDCVECGPQGTILNYLKEKLKDKLLVFSLDADFTSEPMINILTQTYNITKIPTLVIENKVYDKLIGKDDLIKEVCSYYEELPGICIN
jgi:hypothetical protein